MVTEKPPVGYPTLRRKVRRDVALQWRAFTVVTGTVLLGVALFVASFDTARNLQESYDKVFAAQHFADLWSTGGDTEVFADAAKQEPGIADVRMRTQVDVPMAVGDQRLSGRVVGYPVTGQPAVNRVTKLRGSWLSGPDTALVEHHMADHLGVTVGDTVTVQGVSGPRTLQIEGVVSSSEYLWPARSRQQPLASPDDFGVLFVPENTARAVAGLDAPNQVVVQLKGNARAWPDLQGRLAETAVFYGATDVLTRDKQPSNAVLGADTAGFRAMSLVFPLLFLTAAGLAAYVLLTRRVARERPLIGMLRAAGARRRTVALHYLAFGVAAGLCGAVGGAVVGAVGARVLSVVYGNAVDLPESARVLALFRPVTFAAALALGPLTGMLAAAAPALAACRVPPGAAMRGIAPVPAGRHSWAERLVPPLRRLPVRWRMVLRGVGRNRRRSVTSAAGVGLALLVVLTSWTFLDTTIGLQRTQFDQVTRQDAQVLLAGDAAEVLPALRAAPGVAAVEPVIERRAAIVRGSEGYGTDLRAMSAGTTLHGFRTPAGEARDLPATGLLLGRAIGQRLDLRVGDEVLLRLQGVDSAVQAPVAGFVEEPFGTFAYARTSWLRDTVGDLPAQTVLLRHDPGADPDVVRRAVTSLDGVVAYTDSAAVERIWDDHTRPFVVVVAVLLLFGGLLAFGILLATMTTNLVERRRELAVLRVAGVRSTTLARLVTGEGVLVALLGVVPGLLLGVVSVDLLLGSYTSDILRLDAVVQPLTLVLATGAVLAVAMLAQWPGLRAVRRTDIAEVLRERGD
ncbi:MAG: ABC transporter permease [Actinomycetes bacterium]